MEPITKRSRHVVIIAPTSKKKNYGNYNKYKLPNELIIFESKIALFSKEFRYPNIRNGLSLFSANGIRGSIA